MVDKEKIKMLISLINKQVEKIKEEEKKLSDLKELLRNEIKKNVDNLDNKSIEELVELRILLYEIMETVKENPFFSIFSIKKEIKYIIWKIIGEEVYREQKCEQKNITREKFEQFWKEYTAPSLGTSSFYDCYPSSFFLTMYEKIFEREFPF
jgi:hypothetical protein